MIRSTAFTFFTLLSVLPASAGILEDYIAKENEAFNYEISKEITDLGVRISAIRLTSQEWRGKEWKHWLTVFVPPVVDPHKRGVLLIEGGRNRDGL
ncbi:MAG: PhoPQ-activated protein PqaA family protein, partial [Roseibacillus sp.]|nr:PhoPQ-activated protein PqaA family protein [Roseibacillus sp.]